MLHTRLSSFHFIRQSETFHNQCECVRIYEEMVPWRKCVQNRIAYRHRHTSSNDRMDYVFMSNTITWNGIQRAGHSDIRLTTRWTTFHTLCMRLTKKLCSCNAHRTHPFVFHTQQQFIHKVLGRFKINTRIRWLWIIIINYGMELYMYIIITRRHPSH